MKLQDTSIPANCYLTVDKNGTALKPGDTLESESIVEGFQPIIRTYPPVQRYLEHLVVPDGKGLRNYLTDNFVRNRCVIVKQ